MTFFRLGPDEVRQLIEQSSDGGQTWTVTFDGTYTRGVVFASNVAEARAVAGEIAHKACWNSGYFSGGVEALALRPACTCPASPGATSGRP